MFKRYFCRYVFIWSIIPCVSNICQYSDFPGIPRIFCVINKQLLAISASLYKLADLFAKILTSAAIFISWLLSFPIYFNNSSMHNIVHSLLWNCSHTINKADNFSVFHLSNNYINITVSEFSNK